MSHFAPNPLRTITVQKTQHTITWYRVPDVRIDGGIDFRDIYGSHIMEEGPCVVFQVPLCIIINKNNSMIDWTWEQERKKATEPVWFSWKIVELTQIVEV